jgi:hypothetical protein
MGKIAGWKLLDAKVFFTLVIVCQEIRDVCVGYVFYVSSDGLYESRRV